MTTSLKRVPGGIDTNNFVIVWQPRLSRCPIGRMATVAFTPEVSVSIYSFHRPYNWETAVGNTDAGQPPD